MTESRSTVVKDAIEGIASEWASKDGRACGLSTGLGRNNCARVVTERILDWNTYEAGYEL